MAGAGLLSEKTLSVQDRLKCARRHGGEAPSRGIGSAHSLAHQNLAAKGDPV